MTCSAVVLFHVVESTCIPLTVTAAANVWSESVPVPRENVIAGEAPNNQQYPALTENSYGQKTRMD